MYSLKQEVEAWLNSQGITNVSVQGLGKGCRGVMLWFLKGTNEEFIKKYSKLDCHSHNGWLTKEGDSRIYVSMTKRRGL
jgi:hypothetical protein